MTKNDKFPDFNFDDLLASMKQSVDHAAGKVTAHTQQLTKRAEAFSGGEVAALKPVVSTRGSLHFWS